MQYPIKYKNITHEVSIYNLLLQMRKRRHKKFDRLAQNHTLRQEWKPNLNSGRQALGAQALNHK